MRGRRAETAALGAQLGEDLCEERQGIRACAPLAPMLNHGHATQTSRGRELVGNPGLPHPGRAKKDDEACARTTLLPLVPEKGHAILPPVQAGLNARYRLALDSPAKLLELVADVWNSGVAERPIDDVERLLLPTEHRKRLCA